MNNPCDFFCGGYPIDYEVVLVLPAGLITGSHIKRRGICVDCLRYAEYSVPDRFVSVKKVEK